jgi:hypothetical protein
MRCLQRKFQADLCSLDRQAQSRKPGLITQAHSMTTPKSEATSLILTFEACNNRRSYASYPLSESASLGIWTCTVAKDSPDTALSLHFDDQNRQEHHQSHLEAHLCLECFLPWQTANRHRPAI